MIYDYQSWQAGTSRGVELNETHQADSGDVTTSKSRGKLKPLYILYRNAHGHKTWQDDD